MVRLKNRWLVLRVDQMEDTTGGVCEKKNRPVSSLPWLSKRDLFLLINDLFTESFGITYSGALRETKVQLCDQPSRLVLIKTPRRIAAKMRAVLACVASLPVADGNEKKVPVVLTVVGEHGSLRTAKRSMISKLRAAYQRLIQPQGINIQSTAVAASSSDEKMLKIGQSLQTILQELHDIDF